MWYCCKICPRGIALKPNKRGSPNKKGIVCKILREFTEIAQFEPPPAPLPDTCGFRSPPPPSPATAPPSVSIGAEGPRRPRAGLHPSQRAAGSPRPAAAGACARDRCAIAPALMAQSKECEGMMLKRMLNQFGQGARKSKASVSESLPMASNSLRPAAAKARAYWFKP